MATRTRKKPVNAAYVEKAPTEVHVGFADYIAKTTGVEMDAATVGLVQRLYPLYLKTPEVVAARDAEKRARDEENARREAEKRAKLQARLDKIEAQRAKVYAALGLDPQDEAPDAEKFTSGAGIVFGGPVTGNDDLDLTDEDDEDDDESPVAVVAVEDDDEDEDDF